MIRYESKKVATNQKLRGGYYTPHELTLFIAQWIDCEGKSVLEPSCGDGNFLESLLLVSKPAQITAIEIDSVELHKAIARTSEVSTGVEIEYICGDFFSNFRRFENKKFDAVVGNPPYIRFQYFDDSVRKDAFELLGEYGYTKNKMLNAWAAFTQLCIHTLKDNGRIAMVLPAELLQVKYSGELRERLVRAFRYLTIVSFRKIVFPGILQEVVILLADGRTDALENIADVRAVEVEDASSLADLDLNRHKFHPANHTIAGGHKWTSIYVDNNSIEFADKLLRRSKGINRLGEFVKVNVGIVTGRNRFFVLTKDIVEEYDLHNFVTPLVGKTGALKSLDFDSSDFIRYSGSFPAYLLDLDHIHDSDFTPNLWAYIESGKAEGVHRGYKCRIRKRWYAVPSAHKSDGFLYRQVYKYPLMVGNTANAVCTDTVHRVFLHSNSRFSIKELTGAFVNSLTFAYSELLGRSYGGGVLELEPREALLLPIPTHHLDLIDHNVIDNYIAHGHIQQALDYNDEILLKRGLGLTEIEVQELRSVWSTLASRRLDRGKSESN